MNNTQPWVWCRCYRCGRALYGFGGPVSLHPLRLLDAVLEHKCRRTTAYFAGQIIERFLWTHIRNPLAIVFGRLNWKRLRDWIFDA